MSTLLAKVTALQTVRGLTFDQAFKQVLAQENHTGSFGRPTLSGDATLIGEAKAGESETDAARATVQAQHRDWTPEQCETFLWETVWT